MAACVAWLLFMASFEGCASAGGTTAGGAGADSADVLLLGKTAIGADEVRDLNGQPAAEKRRRLDIVLAAHPGDLPARFLRAEAEIKLGDDVAVISDTQALLADPALTGRSRLWVLDWRADALVHARRPKEAIAAADEALGIDDADAVAYFARGWARFHANRVQTDDALADLDRALQLQPDEGVGHYRRGVVLQSRGVLDRATQDFERAVQLVPHDLPTRREYGILLLQAHDAEGALAQFDAATRLAPSDPEVWEWHAQADRALGRLGDTEADERHVDELGAASADLAEMHHRVADVLEDQQDFVGAEREYQRSLALAADPSVAYWLARMQWFNGRFEQPIAYFREHAAARDVGAYAPIWLFVARGRANPADEGAARTELVKLAPPHEPHEWIDTLVGMLLGDTSLDAALAEADAASTYKLRAGRRCEADYYAAEELLMHGRKDAADQLLREATWLCPSTYIEAHAVTAARRLLEADAPAH